METFKIKFNALFFPDKEVDREDGKLRLRVRWEGGMASFNVGYRVKLTQWDASTQRYKAMKPYIDIADATKAEAMKLFNR